MSGKSNLQMSPEMAQLMESMQCENLYQLHKRTGVPLATLRNCGYYGAKPSVATLYRLSQTTGRSLPELMHLFRIEAESA